MAHSKQDILDAAEQLFRRALSGGVGQGVGNRVVQIRNQNHGDKRTGGADQVRQMLSVRRGNRVAQENQVEIAALETVERVFNGWRRHDDVAGIAQNQASALQQLGIVADSENEREWHENPVIFKFPI